MPSFPRPLVLLAVANRLKTATGVDQLLVEEFGRGKTNSFALIFVTHAGPDGSWQQLTPPKIRPGRQCSHEKHKCLPV